jgi:hypothetical protein
MTHRILVAWRTLWHDPGACPSCELLSARLARHQDEFMSVVRENGLLRSRLKRLEAS